MSRKRNKTVRNGKFVGKHGHGKFLQRQSSHF